MGIRIQEVRDARGPNRADVRGPNREAAPFTGENRMKGEAEVTPPEGETSKSRRALDHLEPPQHRNTVRQFVSEITWECGIIKV